MQSQRSIRHGISKFDYANSGALIIAMTIVTARNNQSPSNAELDSQNLSPSSICRCRIRKRIVLAAVPGNLDSVIPLRAELRRRKAPPTYDVGY
jgi:aerobic-type carbon monoxide dehydrogenase small subunit (CoxS/CutS family)